MAQVSYDCRYCEKSFIPEPGKPGYIDECPDCLHERTRPTLPIDFESRYIVRFPERRKDFKNVRKLMMKLRIDEAKVYEILAEALKKAGTQI